MAKQTAEFKIGDRVYLRGDPDQVKRMVLKIIETPIGMMYTIRMDGAEVDVYGLELTDKPDTVV
jgi:hypothetical protein